MIPVVEIQPHQQLIQIRRLVAQFQGQFFNNCRTSSFDMYIYLCFKLTINNTIYTRHQSPGPAVKRPVRLPSPKNLPGEHTVPEMARTLHQRANVARQWRQSAWRQQTPLPNVQQVARVGRVEHVDQILTGVYCFWRIIVQQNCC